MAVTGVPMMLHLFLLLGQQATNVDQVLDRYAAAHKQPPVVEATMAASINGSQPANVSVRLNKAESAWFKVTAGDSSYTLSITPKGVTELDGIRKLYELRPYEGRVRLFDSRLTAIIALYPDWLMVEDLRKVAGEKTKWTLTGSGVVNGFPADKIRFKDPSVEILAAVDKTGNIVSIDRTVTTPMGTIRKKWDVKKWANKTSFAPSQLEAPIPLGYMPYALDYSYGGVKVGEKFPLAGWQDSSSGKQANLSSSKPRLFVLLSEDAAPSQVAYDWLPSLKSKIPVTVLSDGKGASKYRGALIDRSGKSLETLDVQGTPYFALVGRDGTIVKLWMGFDRASAGAFEQDIVSAAAGN